jgi:hypothetical protein
MSMSAAAFVDLLVALKPCTVIIRSPKMHHVDGRCFCYLYLDVVLQVIVSRYERDVVIID